VSQYTQDTVIVLIAAKRPGRVSYHSWGSRAMRCASAVKRDDSYPKPRAVPTPCGIRVQFVAASYSAVKLAKPRCSRSAPVPWTTRHPSGQRSRSLPATVQLGLSFRRTSAFSTRCPQIVGLRKADIFPRPTRCCRCFRCAPYLGLHRLGVSEARYRISSCSGFREGFKQIAGPRIVSGAVFAHARHELGAPMMARRNQK
jgi:hypothetical protein